MIRFIAAFSIILCLVGCEKDDPHPELRDPIYKDLKALEEGHQKALEEAKKRLEESTASLEKAEANSMDRKDALKGLASARAKVLDHEQWLRFYKIRAQRRVVVDKITEKEASSSKKPWPNPSEYSDYLVNKRLREVNLNWNSRVPKLQSRLSKPPAKGAKKGEGEGERKPAASEE